GCFRRSCSCCLLRSSRSCFVNTKSTRSQKPLERTETMTGSLHVALAAFGAAIAVGIIGMKASEAVGRNPGSSTKVLVQSILAIAFAEAIVFYTLFLVR